MPSQTISVEVSVAKRLRSYMKQMKLNSNTEAIDELLRGINK